VPDRSDYIANSLTAVLATCAVLITVVAVRHEFFAAPAAAEGAAFPRPRPIKNGASLTTEGNVLGTYDAPFKIVEFSDFQCPFCKDMARTIEELQRRYPGRVSVVYRHLPLRIHPHARDAALAAECAGAQGRFAAYHDLLFDHQDSIGAMSWEKIAADAGVPNAAAFRACRAGNWAKQRLAEDSLAAQRIQATGTPSLVVGNEALGAALPLDSLVSWIRRVAPKALGSVERRGGSS
jgi:protein-disulfide isomerase